MDGFEQGNDLLPARFPELSWGESDLATSIDAVHDWVDREIVRAAEWYKRAKRSKARRSLALRTAAALLATAGVSLPFAAAATGRIGAEWGYIVLLLAAATLAIDWYFGYSSARTRFATTEAAIVHVRTELQFDWAAMSVERGQHPIDADEATKLLAMLGRATAAVEDLRARETAAWRQSRWLPRSRGMGGLRDTRTGSITLKPMTTLRLPNAKSALPQPPIVTPCGSPPAQ